MLNPVTYRSNDVRIYEFSRKLVCQIYVREMRNQVINLQSISANKMIPDM
jgi:hypothetical protein